MKKLFIAISCIFLLNSCSTSTIGINKKDLEEAILSYDYNCLGYRKWSQKEIVNTLNSDSVYVYNLKDVKSFLAVYIPKDFTKLDDDLSLSTHSFLNGDYIDGRNVFFNKDKRNFSTLLIEYNSIDDIDLTIKQKNKTYCLDLVFVEKEIEYIYDMDLKEEIDINNTFYIRNSFKVEGNKLVRPTFTNDITPGISQVMSEFYFTDLTGIFYGKSSGKDNEVIGNVIDEYSLFEVSKIEGKEYVKYPVEINSTVDSDEIAKVYLGKYFEEMKNDYIIKNQYIYFSLDKIKDI